MIFDLSMIRKTFHCLFMAGASGKRSFVCPSKFPLLPCASPSVSFLAQQTENDVSLIPLASFENLVMVFILSAIPEYLAFYILICLYYLRKSP